MNNINMSSTNRIEVLEKKIIDIIEEEHSKINLQIPFRTDIGSEMNTENDRANYSKQYSYALSISDVVKT